MAHFEAHVFFLCNGNEEVLQQVSRFDDRKWNEGSGEYDNEKSKRGRTGKQKMLKKAGVGLQARDEVYFYLMHENYAHSLERLAKEWGLSKSTGLRIVSTWAVVHHRRWQSVGWYPSYEEHLRMQPTWWVEKYGAGRYALWDTTDVPLEGKPSAMLLQQLTYSEYYGGNVLKAGVGMTEFDWLIPGPLTTSVTDTHYMTLAGILKRQQDVGELDAGAPPYANITDKGMKAERAAWDHGRQTLLTPSFKAKGQQHISPLQLLLTTCVAKDRAANERMVRRPCSFGYVKRGIHLSKRIDLVCMIWENICFRCNTVYRPLSLTILSEWNERQKSLEADESNPKN